jgi:hypothetical protein
MNIKEEKDVINLLLTREEAKDLRQTVVRGQSEHPCRTVRNRVRVFLRFFLTAL